MTPQREEDSHLRNALPAGASATHPFGSRARMSSTSVPNQLAVALVDRYVLERELGRGGMATVYLARDVKHNRPVAVKVLDPEHGAVLGAERFLSEIRVTANLQHPNLLPLFDSGEAEGLLYYVMPYVEGETLRHRLEREKQLPVDEAVCLAVAIADALDYALGHDVIHRDLKPENILLQHGQPIVADLGIALAVTKAGGARVTATGLSLGTPQYMSPEQATGDRVIDGRTDIYSLGAMTYEMLAGEPPHVGMGGLWCLQPRGPALLSRRQLGGVQVERQPDESARRRERGRECACTSCGQRERWGDRLVLRFRSGGRETRDILSRPHGRRHVAKDRGSRFFRGRDLEQPLHPERRKDDCPSGACLGGVDMARPPIGSRCSRWMAVPAYSTCAELGWRRCPWSRGATRASTGRPMAASFCSKAPGYREAASATSGCSTPTRA